MKIAGKAWVFDRAVGATDIVSSNHDKAGMSRDWDECRKHLLEDVDPNFAAHVAPGDIIFSGANLGRGHAHYYTASIMSCKTAGISAILCTSINALFQRCAIDLGFLAWPIYKIVDLAVTGDYVEIDLLAGEARNITKGEYHRFDPVAPLILDIVKAGGSLDWAMRRVGADVTTV
tara:strand:+ start:1247 stop:1771 length:525 start_codon:yes stop_codon:yes gene_type:complete